MFPLRWLLALCWGMAPYWLLAQHQPEHSTSPVEHQQHATEGHLPHPPTEEHVHHDAIELFVGESSHLGRHHGLNANLTLGLDYEHRFSFWHNHLGLGLMLDCECVNGEALSDWMITPTVEIYPFSHLKVFAGAGVCLQSFEPMPMWRAGGAYEIPFGHHLLLMPLVGIDHTPTFTAIMSGLCIGFGR